MKRLLAFLFLLSLFSGCSATREATKAKERLDKYTADLWQQEPVKPDSISGYLPNPEINLLDALQRKYPGTAKTKVVTRTETVTLPPKTVYVTLPVQHDTIENIAVRDSLLSQIERLARNAQENSELKAAYASLRIRLLQELNRRGCLPDTLVDVVGFGFTFTMHVIPHRNGTYGFELVKARQDVRTNAEITETTRERTVFIDRRYYQFWQFWLVFILLGGLSVWLFYLRIRDAKPATR